MFCGICYTIHMEITENRLQEITDILLDIQEDIGNIVKLYGKTDLTESLLGIRFQKRRCEKLLNDVMTIHSDSSLANAVCRQTSGILQNNISVLTELEKNCITNQENLNSAKLLEMMARIEKTKRNLKGEFV